MHDPSRTYQELIEEIAALKRRIQDLEYSEAERKQAKEEIRRRASKYQQLVEQAPDGIFTITVQGRFILANTKFCQMLGYTKEECLLRNILDTYPVDMRTVGIRRLAELQRGERLHFERPMQRLDGGIIFVEARAWKDNDGNVQAIVRDITDRKRSEEELRETEQRLCHLADNLSHAVVYQLTAEPDGGRRFTYISRAVERLNEVTEGEALADASVIYKQVLPEYLAQVRQHEEEALKNLTTVRVEVQSRLPSGRLRWFEFVSTPRRQADGLLVWDGVELDITERKQA